MQGIILCGGKSQRMGTDKGLILQGGKIWAQLAAEKLHALKIPLAYSVNSDQRDIYSSHLGINNLITDDLQLSIKGPLLGVLSAHRRHPDEDLYLLACDLQLMDTRLLRLLLSNYAADQSFDVYVFTNNGEQEPLCGIYKSHGLKRIMNTIQTSGLERHSMKYALSLLEVCQLPLPQSDRRYFTNYNSRSQLDGL